MRTKTLLLVATIAAGLVLGASSPTASEDIWKGPGDRPLVSQRYGTIRALARHLDETAQSELEGASGDTRHGASSDARYLSSIRSFARRAHDFYTMIENDQRVVVE